MTQSEATGRKCVTISCPLYMDYKPNWNRTSTSAGYVVVHCPDHPHAWKGTGYVLAHRIVLEQKLGRLLQPHEVVHHKNGDKHDNSVENLELTTASEHTRHHRPNPNKAATVTLTCPQCDRRFKRRRGSTNLVPSRPNKRTFCSRRCNGLFGAN